MPKLDKLTITEVALCPEGMNQEAKITLFKSTDSLSEGGDQKPQGKDDAEGFWKKLTQMLGQHKSFSEEEKQLAEIKSLDDLLKSLPEDQRKIVESALAEKDRLIAEKTVEKAPTEDEFLKSMPEAVRTQWEQMRKDNEILKTRAQLVEIEKRVGAFSGVADQVALIELIKQAEDLQSVAKDSTSFVQKLETVLKTAQERIAAGQLFTEFGKQTTTNEDSAEGTLQKLTSELLKSRSDLSYAVAYDMTVQQNPGLYGRYLKERGA